MDYFKILGGNKLNGNIKVESAKNSILPMIAASVMCEEKITLLDCPKIIDVFSMIEIISYLGGSAFFLGDDLVIDCKNVNKFDIPERLTKKLRSSVFLTGGLLSRFKKADIRLPGGCNIGKRPIDIHIQALKDKGVNIDEFDDGFFSSYQKKNKDEIKLSFASVGATENLIMASVLDSGETTILNGAIEPEVEDLCNFLNRLGAKIYFNSKGKYKIIGVKKLHGTSYRAIGDRIEAGTFLIASMMCGGKIEISNIKVKNLYSFINNFSNITCKMYIKNDIITITSENRGLPFNIETAPYPYFPTDMQAQAMAYATICQGESIITENIFENRFHHVKELKKMGANITVFKNMALVKGVDKLVGCDLFAEDLRGGASLVLASLVAEGYSTVHQIHYIDRGYYNFHIKLANLGANIERISF